MQQSQNGVYIMVIEGSIAVADQTLQHRDAIGLWNTNSIDMTITKNSKVLVVEVPMI
jgi:redox-sensitive bicupin YhaK (pirin superfamily)